jgi:thiosulfate/3-mercaptopyruvate sulfurtransferase
VVGVAAGIDPWQHRRMTSGIELPGPLVSADWLAAHRDDVVIADVRWYPDGRPVADAFAGGHVPGAVLVDLDHDLSAPGSATEGRHPLPTPAAFAAAMRRLGIGDGTPVVVTDDAAGSLAARLWFLLHVLGHPVAVLDGGNAAWSDPLATGGGSTGIDEQATFTERPWPADRFVTIDEVDARRNEPGWLLLDARAAERFDGLQTPLDPRPGHIPGATSAPWADNIDPDTKRFVASDDLRARFERLGAGEGVQIAASCGSGVTACHDLLALELRGFGAGTKLYVGSWSQWAADPDRPIE